MSTDPPNNAPDIHDDPDDYLRAECDHLLQQTSHDSDSEHDHPADSTGLLGEEEPAEEEDEILQRSSRLALSGATLESRKRRAFFVRTLALLCACSLSVGSH